MRLVDTVVDIATLESINPFQVLSSRAGIPTHTRISFSTSCLYNLSFGGKKHKAKILAHCSHIFMVLYFIRQHNNDHKSWSHRKLNLNPSFTPNLHVSWDKLPDHYEILFPHLKQGANNTYLWFCYRKMLFTQ